MTATFNWNVIPIPCLLGIAKKNHVNPNKNMIKFNIVFWSSPQGADRYQGAIVKIIFSSAAGIDKPVLRNWY
ncbi:MAG: hypothetical protein OEZ59_14200 [Deltaproteobacteria bacterium]|nr:hypothetical protein [Deltaproteobacteria bacterium]